MHNSVVTNNEFWTVQIPNNICISQNDEYEYKFYSEFEKLFVGNIRIIGLNYSNNNKRILGLKYSEMNLIL